MRCGALEARGFREGSRCIRTTSERAPGMLIHHFPRERHRELRVVAKGVDQVRCSHVGSAARARSSDALNCVRHLSSPHMQLVGVPPCSLPAHHLVVAKVSIVVVVAAAAVVAAVVVLVVLVVVVVVVLVVVVVVQQQQLLLLLLLLVPVLMLLVHLAKGCGAWLAWSTQSLTVASISSSVWPMLRHAVS